PYGDNNTDSNTNTHVYSDGNTHRDSNSYTYFDAKTFTYAESCANAQAASHASTTSITLFDEKGMYRSIGLFQSAPVTCSPGLWNHGRFDVKRNTTCLLPCRPC